MKAAHPVHREEIRRGHIYVAPPDNQLLLRPGRMEVVRGPKENGHRPAVDALFRTTAQAYGPRVTSEMPRSVIGRVDVDHVVSPAELPVLLARLVAQPVADKVESAPSATIRRLDGQELGRPAPIVCPACQGTLTETSEGDYQFSRQADIIRDMLLYESASSIPKPTGP